MSFENLYIPDELLVKHLMQETSPDERMLVEKWLAQDEAHRRYYQQLKWLMDQTVPVPVPYVDEEAAWQRFRQRIQKPKEEQVAPPAKVRIMGFSRMRIAALFILALGIGLMAVLLTRQDEPPQLAVISQEQVVKETLPDGSEVTLNKHSKLSYTDQFKGKTRQVHLQGEAFFSVRPDKKKPFLIQVNDITVKVVGTSFNIKTVEGRTEVIVETGVVQVTRNGKTIELRPGETVTVENKDTTLQSEKVQDQLYNYYHTKEFVCDNTPLWKLVEALNEAYGVKIRIEGKELRSLPITTTFHNESLDHILEVIRTTFELSVEKKGDEVILK